MTPRDLLLGSIISLVWIAAWVALTAIVAPLRGRGRGRWILLQIVLFPLPMFLVLYLMKRPVPDRPPDPPERPA
jgi:hypothetical protein